MGGFILTTLTVAVGIGLFCGVCVWLEKSGCKHGKVVYDENAGQCVYKASVFEWATGIAVFLLIFGIIVFYMVFDGFSSSSSMPGIVAR